MLDEENGEKRSIQEIEGGKNYEKRRIENKSY